MARLVDPQPIVDPQPTQDSPAIGDPLPITVIIPTRDTRELTLRCLAALAASDAAPAEILLVDDGSRDGTAEAVRAAYPHTRIETMREPGGFTRSINAAWPLATQAIVLLLNSDTEVDPQALGRMVAAFARDPRLGVAGASLQYPDGRPQWSAGREPTALWLFAMASGLSAAAGRLPGWRRVRPESQAGRHAFGDAEGDADGDAGWDAVWVPATAMAVRREVQTAIGLFDATFGTYAQDLDYCVRARAAGWRVAQLREVVVRHVQGATISCFDADGLRQNPEALFVDLSRWLRAAHAPRIARRRCGALSVGCRMRIAARQVLRWFKGSQARAV